jgi:tRNA threonylcarbamoyladenosine biosynthesis protein TsaB
VITLAIEAAVSVGSVALLHGGVVLAEDEVPMKGAHEERLMPAVARLLEAEDVTVRDIARFVCGAGPGSFTSLRIAASIAKGLAVATGTTLIALPSPLLMLGAHLPLPEGQYLALLDAMRGDCFVSLYAVDASRVHTRDAPPVLSRDDAIRFASRVGATTIGPGMTIDARPHARGAVLLGTFIDEPPPVDLDAWEPDYGRLAEAQTRWEQAHGRPLSAGEPV